MKVGVGVGVGGSDRGMGDARAFFSVRCASAERTRTRRIETTSAGSTLFANDPTTAPTIVVGSCFCVVCVSRRERFESIEMEKHTVRYYTCTYIPS